jgi:CDGSH-type Zn-finger protein
MNELPVMSKKGPYAVNVEEGKTYWWCACGKSSSQPFCDGSHKNSEYTPVEFIAEKTGMVAFCGCKRTKNKPRCDDTHFSIKG